MPARSYSHYYGSVDLPKPIPEKELIVLVHQLRNGIDVTEQIAHGHMRLAMQIVGRYIFKLGTDKLADELVGVAMLAVVRAVKDAARKLRDNNITPYIVARIHNDIGTYLVEDKLIRIPMKSFYRHKLKGKEREEFYEVEHKEPSPLSLMILEEDVAAICTNSVDREILRMRIKGATDAEIGRVIGLSQPAILKRRVALQQKWTKLNGN